MEVSRSKEEAKKYIETLLSYLKKLETKEDKEHEYNNCTFTVLDFALTTKLITYKECKEYKKRALDIIECPFDI